jgi:predicted O-methyltransferase YrrM
MNVPALDGRLLYDTIIKSGYKRGLEIGTSNGYSGLWLGLAFKITGGTLITLELEPKRAREAQANFKKAGLDHIIESRIADAFGEIPQINGRFDFIFMDAWKSDYLAFWHLVKDRIKPGGVITAHNVSNARGEMTDFLDEIQSDSSFTTVIDKTSYAGVSFSFKNK